MYRKKIIIESNLISLPTCMTTSVRHCIYLKDTFVGKFIVIYKFTVLLETIPASNTSVVDIIKEGEIYNRDYSKGGLQ